jgi:glycosyltransferase involved in cell wall biosynthesis
MVMFSVIIPNKDREKLLYRAVESVMAQTCDDFEILIVDDSDDDVFERIEKRLSGLTNVRVIRGDQRGESWARKKGFDMAVGKYVALLDSDDFWKKDKLIRHLSLLKSDKKIGVTWDKLIHTEERNSEKRLIEIPVRISDYVSKYSSYSIPPEVVMSELVYDNFIHASSGIIDKEKLNTIGGFLPLLPSDYIQWLRMSEKFYFGLVDDYLTIRFNNSTSMSMKKVLLLKDSWHTVPMRMQYLLKSQQSISRKFLFSMYLTTLLFGVSVFIPKKLRIKIRNKSRQFIMS